MCYVTSCLEPHLYSHREFITAREFLELREVISERHQNTPRQQQYAGFELLAPV
jgi:hypothetical protein